MHDIQGFNSYQMVIPIQMEPFQLGAGKNIPANISLYESEQPFVGKTKIGHIF